jgi:FkbM family methyltransferase
MEFAETYPDATIHAFEPITAAYDELVTAVQGLQKVTTHRYAIGSKPSTAVMKSVGVSTGNKIITGRPPGADQEQVEVINGDQFCEANGIPRINYLKVDTEGFDLQVLLGFQKMLAESAIDVIQVEAATFIDNFRQVPISRIIGYLEPMDYHLFGFYGPARDFRGLPVLARVDPVFNSRPVIEANTIVRGR